MAIQSGVISFRKKVGELVGYKVTNAAKAGVLGFRQYVATIANPKTQAQATQRMRMRPAINFYRGLSSLLDHSWEGVKYGARSRAKFMELALLPGQAVIPFVDKGEARFIPGEYPVSLGSVGVSTGDISFVTEDGKIKAKWGDLGNLTVESDTTFGDFSRSVLGQKAGLNDGDEITVVLVFKVGDNYVPLHYYFILDVNSLALANDVFTSSKLKIGDEGVLKFIEESGEELSVAQHYDCVAAAVIVSRHPSRTSTTWLRSSSKLVCSDALKAEWMSDARFAAARATYMQKNASLESDWLLNQAENDVTNGVTPGGGNGTTYLVTNQQKTFGGVTASMACLSVDSAGAKPVLYNVNNAWFYGVLSGNTINFGSDDSQKLSTTPTSGTYYTWDQLQAATDQYVKGSSQPVIEQPE